MCLALQQPRLRSQSLKPLVLHLQYEMLLLKECSYQLQSSFAIVRKGHAFRTTPESELASRKSTNSPNQSHQVWLTRRHQIKNSQSLLGL